MFILQYNQLLWWLYISYLHSQFFLRRQQTYVQEQLEIMLILKGFT